MAECIHCPYHSPKWRSVSQFILNQMRVKELLKPQHILRFPAVVCACPGKVSKTEISLLPTKEDLKSWEESLNGSSPDKIYPSIQRLLKAANKEEISEAYKQFLYRMLSVVYLVYHDKNSFLEPPPRLPQSVSTPPVLEEATPEEPPKQYKEEVFSLDIPVTPVTYIGTLIGKGGAGLKALCAEYGVTSVHLGDVVENIKGRKRSRMSYVNSSPVRVSFKYELENQKAVGFKKALEERAKMICRKRQKHFETVQNYQAARVKRAREWRKQRELRMLCEHVQQDTFFDPKLAASSVTKHRYKNKEKDKQKTKPPSILEESKCLHCLQPHSTDNKQCTYHPGYTAEVKHKGKLTKRWTCCNQYYRQYNSLMEEHTRTGCTIGLHIWRPLKSIKRRSKPASNNKEETEDITVMQKKQ